MSGDSGISGEPKNGVSMDPAETSAEVQRAKAPWDMTGDAYVLMLKMPEGMLDTQCFVPDSLMGLRLGSPSQVMYVDYKSSPVGPYKELLFMPGKFRFGKKVCKTISKIFVSTRESVVNGVENWGIPKTLARFETRTTPDGHERILVSAEDLVFADLTFSVYSFAFPYSDGWVPERFKAMAQPYQGKIYFYAPTTRATIKRARLRKSRIDARLFPDISQGKPLQCVRLQAFRMHIPAAAILTQR
jgi:hypothetical protein